MLDKKTALITGASRGIGKSIALKFAENNAFVGINYVSNDKKAEETLETINEKGGEGLLLKGDISSPSDVEQIVDALIKNRKQIDILVHNAGIYFRNSFDEIPDEIWEKMMSTNLSSCFYLTKKALPYMKSGAKIIFVSSQMAFRGSPHGSDYAATKAGMIGLMRSLALELADKNILVNAVAPGTIDTDIIGHYSGDMRKKRISEVPLKRLGVPEDVANTCLFLASDLSDYITGETINVNGGLYIH